MRGGDGVITGIGKWLLRERIVGVKRVMFVGGVCGIKWGDGVGVRDGVVNTRGRSCRWSVVGIPVPRERRKAANIYFGIMILMTVGPVGEEVIIVVRNSWSRSL